MVKVVSDSGNKFRFDDFGASAQTLDLQEGGTYTFDQADSSNSGHPFVFGTSANATDYTTGVTTTGTPGNAGAKTVITVAASAPALYYTCSNHSGMGGAVNTNTTFGSSYFDGTIKSKTSANTTSGFSIVKYTGNDTAGATVAHGLGAAPNLVIIKNLAAAQGWVVGSPELGTTGDTYGGLAEYYILTLDTTTAKGNWSQDTIYGLTSSTFSIGSGGTMVMNNNSSYAYVAYCFADVVGYSKVGTYRGNGNANGNFIYTGFRPAWLMARRIDSTSSWYTWDIKRNTYNARNTSLWPNDTWAEATYTDYSVDFLSNGFKPRFNNSYFNYSGGEHLYIAFAEYPFKYANAR